MNEMSPESVTHGHHHISAVRGLAASAVFIVMLVAALALWTAIPLGWIWIGSKVSSSRVSELNRRKGAVIGAALPAAPKPDKSYR